MSDLGRTAREVMVPLLCPDLGARTFVLGVGSWNTRPQRVVIRSDESVIRRRSRRDNWAYVDGEFAGGDQVG